MASSSPAEPITLKIILSETNRILNAHSRHFLALSLIFLLPISFLITISPTLLLQLQQSSHLNNHILTLITTPNPKPNSTYPLLIVSDIVFSALLLLCGVGVITFSTFHGFYGRPVRLSLSMRSLVWNGVGVFVTLLLVMFVVGVFAVPLLFVVRVWNISLWWINWLVGVFGVLVLVYVQVNCTLACVVVVVEAKWGIKALRRSVSLVNGMRLVSLWLLVFGCVTVVFPLWLNSVPLVRFEGEFDFWKSAGFVAQTVLSSSFVTLFMLICISANAVLYMYCKALHGELASEIAEEFARDYVSLPFDDEKVPHIVTVVLA